VTTVRQRMLRSEDFPAEIRQALDPLLRYCNDLNTDCSSILNGGLSLSVNGASFVATVTTSTFPVQIKNQLKSGGKPVGVLLVHALDVTTASSAVPAAVSGCPGWQMAGSNVSITAVTGLTSGHRYQLAFLVLG
jgi:hypothetical protein